MLYKCNPTRKNAGINSSFTVRKISYGEGIERVLPLYSPQIEKIELVKSGDVRRSKLYYLRGRSGKSARIAEKNTYNQATSEKSDNKRTEDTKSVTSEKKTANSDEVKTKAADDVEKKE